MRLLRAELRTREAQALRELLRESNLVASTINGASHSMLEKEVFDVVIIDMKPRKRCNVRAGLRVCVRRR